MCLCPVTHETENVNWDNEAGTRFRSLALAAARAKVGIRDVEKRRIRFEKVLTPQSPGDSEFALHRGATFSMAHNLGQMLHNRPHNRFEDADGVYLVGGGTHPGSGSSSHL